MAARLEVEDVLRELAQQQSALSQQQTALLQLQTESLRLQRLLIERALGGPPTEEVVTVVTTESAHRVAPEPPGSKNAPFGSSDEPHPGGMWRCQIRSGAPLMMIPLAR